MSDKEILRGLAARYTELCATDENKEHYTRCKAVNDLTPLRPPVWIDEIPWHEFSDHEELVLHCEDEFLRGAEWFFREKLFRWKYFRADMVLSPYYPLYKMSTSTGKGLEVNEETISTDDRNHIVSHHYNDQLDTVEKVNKLKLPVLTAYPEKDRERKALLSEIFGDILPVRLCGNYIYHAPWDEIPRLRGVDTILIDLIEEPELMHLTMEKFTQAGLAHIEQCERLGLLDSELQSLHCTPPFTKDLLGADGVEGHSRMKDTWFRAMAQIFSSVSPSTFEEFEFNYMKRLAEKFGLVYYGCCEPLDNVIPILKKLPNLRKLGVSPWSNVMKCAEQIKGDYVYARKPNPAFVSGTLDEKTVENEIRTTILACKEFSCPYEFVLKDISTIGNKLQNLVNWNKVVQKTINEYYR